jgi:hypothetical protein
LLADNDAYVEFNSHSYLVKDQISHQTFLQGTKHDGLYAVSSPTPQTLIYEKNTLQLWHHKLCHTFDTKHQKCKDSVLVLYYCTQFKIFDTKHSHYI